MNSARTNVSIRRIGLTLAAAAAVAGLMLAAAWAKKSLPAGSLASELWEGVILALAVVSILVPTLALRLPSEEQPNSSPAR
jgi:hypothetical protein